MKKKNSRFIGILLTMCLAVTMIAPAYATETSGETQLSEFAGESMTCEVISESETGELSSQIIEVPIPEDATKDEEAALVRAALLPNTRYPFYTLYSGKMVNTIVTGFNFTVAQCVIPESNYATFVILFYGLSPVSAGGGDLSVTVSSSTAGSSSYTMETEVSKTDITVYMTNGLNGVLLQENSTMSVTATTDVGGYDYDNCEVWATTQYYQV